jgi:histone acetyltransferase
LSVYAGCRSTNQTDPCKCPGFKSPIEKNANDAINSTTAAPLLTKTTKCKHCTHELVAHLTHLETLPDIEVNRLMSLVVDVENLYMCVHLEEDNDTKQVYFYLYKLLRKSIYAMSRPTIDGPLGSPPFEKPTIAKVSVSHSTQEQHSELVVILSFL